MGSVLADVEKLPSSEDPIDDLRAMAVTLFDAIVDRPWLGAYFMRNTDTQSNSLRLYETLGRQTLRLDLTARQRFHAVSAIVGVVVGSAIDMGQEPPEEVLDGAVDRDEYLGRYAQSWRELDPEDFPFIHEIVDEFDGHEDVDQFRSALELTLAGLRLQAGSCARTRTGRAVGDRPARNSSARLSSTQKSIVQMFQPPPTRVRVVGPE
jgi:hypothetical protein